MRKKITVVLSALILFGCVENAEAMLVFDPINFGKNAVTALQTTQMVLQQVQSYQTQLQQYDLQLKNIKNFGSFTWQDMSQTLANLGSAIQTGQSLAYSMSNMDSAFKAMYPGYQSPQNYQQSYQNWSTSTLDTVRGALDSISLQASDFATEEQTINSLRGLANNPTGQLQAVQMGNMLAGEGVNQLEELRQLEMTQINSQNSYMAYQVQKDQSQESEDNDLINGMNSTYPQYQNQNGFGPMQPFGQ